MTWDTAEPWCPIPDTRDRSIPPYDLDEEDDNDGNDD